jgi:hypothetical protein
VTSPVPYTKLFSAISADLRCAERWRPGIKMRFIEDGMSVLGCGLNRSTQHLLILLEEEVCDGGECTDMVHAAAEG